MDLAFSYIAILLAYLIGSLSFAVIVSKLMRLPDPRTFGSHNPGATNVLRSGNKVAAVLTLLLDALKGYVPTALVARYSFELGLIEPGTADAVVAFVGAAAFLGHLFPVFFRFQGGKGVATAAGVLFAYEPLLGALTLLVWIVIAAIFRYSSLASILSAMLAPFFMLLIFDRPIVALAVGSMSALLVWRHWRNILKLMAGRESKIGDKPPVDHKDKHRHRHATRLDHNDTAHSPRRH
jgi:acyl phosphate:glycerol-3-phosphate acyltransferase